jgi:hypothetical protein
LNVAIRVLHTVAGEYIPVNQKVQSSLGSTLMAA